MCFAAARSTSAARTALHAGARRSASAGNAAPISYPAGGSCHSRTSRPSGPRQRYRSRSWPGSPPSPRHTTPKRMPNSRASVGHAAGWPKASGEYRTSSRPPSCSASAAPSSRLRTSASPEGISSSARFLPMLQRALLALLAVPAIAGLTLVAVRLTPGPQRDGTTLLPSGWRIHPAGRQVDVGTLPLNVVTLSDGSVLVTNNGYGENGLMRIDPLAGSVVWRLRLKAAWLGLARSRPAWRDTAWAG